MDMRTALLLASLVSLTPQPAVQSFDGTWTADLRGRPIIRLELHAEGNTLTGRIQLADIHVDQTGVVDTVLSDLSAPSPVVDVIVRGRTVAFARHDGDDVDRFELTLPADGGAELRFLVSDADREELARQGVPAPKPFAVSRGRP
jgi:hypothetical protein